MMAASWNLVFSLLFALATALAPAPQAQLPGYCEITSPSDGEPLTGIVPIEGSAHHPLFSHYDVWFAYEDDVTGTWFPLSEDLASPIPQGRLGTWDTTLISDGTYALRLRVWQSDGSVLTAVVRGVRVQNDVLAPVETSIDTVEAESVQSIPTPSPEPGMAKSNIGKQAAERAGVGEALLAGGVAGAATMGLLAAYLGLRSWIRYPAALRRGRARSRKDTS